MNIRPGTKPFTITSLGLLVLIGACIYSNTFAVPFQFDDQSYLLNNPTIRNLNDIPSMAARIGSARLLGYLSFALNYRYHGYEVFGYHLVNLFIHLVNGLLAYALIHAILRTPRLGGRFNREEAALLSLALALIFIAHPMQTQAVTYIYQRLASMATMFYLLGATCYVLGRLNAARRWRLFLFMAISLLAAIAGMFTKQITITLPAMVLFLEFYLFPSERKGGAARVLLIVVLIALAALIPLLYKFNAAWVFSLEFEPDAYVQGKITSFSYALAQPRVLVKYLSLILLPVGQSIDHYFELTNSMIDWRFLGSMGLLLLLAAAGFIWRRSFPLITLGIAWFFITIPVESSFIPIANIIFEHRMYLPSFGWSLVIAQLLFMVFKSRRGFVFALTVLIALYSILSFARNKIWQDPVTLWSDAIRKGPANPRPYYNLAYSHMKKGNHQLAMDFYTKALELKPDYYYALNNRANLLSAAGETSLALKDITAAIDSKPDAGFLYNSRGTLFQRMNDCDSAIKDFTKGIELSPDEAGAYINRGICYGQKGYGQLALADLDKAIALDAELPESYNNRGAIYLKMKAFEVALLDFNKALRLDPRYIDAYYNRALTLASLGQHEKAMADFAVILKYDPDNFKALENRGKVNMQRGDHELALADFNKALAARPENSTLRKHRAYIQMLLGRYQEALTDYDLIIAQEPKLAQAYIERGKLYYKLKMYAKAKVDFNAVILIEPQHKEAHFLRALVEYELKEFDQALADLKKARDLGQPIDDFYLIEFEKSVQSQK